MARIARHLGSEAFVVVDFDRTLCSTRAGADPSVMGKKKPPVADEALVELLASTKRGVVLTRNSHRDGIRKFLDDRHLGHVAVRSAKLEKTSKAAILKSSSTRRTRASRIGRFPARTASARSTRTTTSTSCVRRASRRWRGRGAWCAFYSRPAGWVVAWFFNLRVPRARRNAPRRRRSFNRQSGRVRSFMPPNMTTPGGAISYASAPRYRDDGFGRAGQASADALPASVGGHHFSPKT